MKIYAVIANTFDGDSLHYDIVKAFTDKGVAEEFSEKCEEETKRVQKEVQEYYEIHRKELDEISLRFTKLVHENSKKKIMIDYSELPDSLRRIEIHRGEDKIFKTHKYQPDFSDFDDNPQYDVEEIELEGE